MSALDKDSIKEILAGGDLDETTLSSFREQLEKDWGSGGFPPADGGDGGDGGGGGGKASFVFVDADTYCGHLEDFARDANMLAISTNQETPPAPPPEDRRKFKHYFDFPGYAQRLRSRATDVREKETSGKSFVLCHLDGQVVSVLQLDQATSFGDRPDMKLLSIDWPIEGLSYKFFLVPPRVVKSKIQLRFWLDTQGYNLQDDVGSDPYGI
jgi:hypothetical protein